MEDGGVDKGEDREVYRYQAQVWAQEEGKGT